MPKQSAGMKAVGMAALALGHATRMAADRACLTPEPRTLNPDH